MGIENALKGITDNGIRLNPNFRKAALAKFEIEESRKRIEEERLRAERADRAHEFLMKRYKMIDVRSLDAPEKVRDVSIREIIRRVSNIHKVDWKSVLGAGRNVNLVKARFDAIALAKYLRPDYSLPLLGRHFGKRDHTSILHALRKRGWRSDHWENGTPDFVEQGVNVIMETMEKRIEMMRESEEENDYSN